MPEDVSPIVSELIAEVEQLKMENEAWRNQWKGYTDASELYWEISIRKPRFSTSLLSDVYKYLMEQDMEKLYKTYIGIAIICTILSSVIQMARDLYDIKFPY